jgi:Zn-dependent M28 family amino/carboxypeptidase
MPSRLRDHVEFLARHPRPPASAWHARSRDYIRQHLRDAGYAVADDSAQVAGLPMINLLAEPVPARANDLPLVIVGAHYDSIPGCPGADDNASAVAALLEVARQLRPQIERQADSMTARLQFVAYDLEESGLFGSWRHAQALRQQRTPLRGMISLEMLAYTDHRPRSQHLPAALVGRYPDVGNFIGVVGNEASRELFETVLGGLGSVPGLPVESLLAPAMGRVLPESRLSDHSSFWDVGYPALMVTDTSFYRNPHYHQASDTAATLDYPFLEKVTAGVAAGVWRLLNHAAAT